MPTGTEVATLSSDQGSDFHPSRSFLTSNGSPHPPRYKIRGKVALGIMFERLGDGQSFSKNEEMSRVGLKALRVSDSQERVQGKGGEQQFGQFRTIRKA
jgi:hypothetical protein